MKKNRFLLGKYKKQNFKGKSNNINWSKVLMILMIIVTIMIFSIYFIFFSRKNTKITYNITEKLILNNQTFIDYNKVNIKYGKLIWNNQSSLNYTKIKEEAREYYQLKYSFENKDDFIKREKPKITIIITLYNQKRILIKEKNHMKMKIKAIEGVRSMGNNFNKDNKALIFDLNNNIHKYYLNNTSNDYSRSYMIVHNPKAQSGTNINILLLLNKKHINNIIR